MKNIINKFLHFIAKTVSHNFKPKKQTKELEKIRIQEILNGLSDKEFTKKTGLKIVINRLNIQDK